METTPQDAVLQVAQFLGSLGLPEDLSVAVVVWDRKAGQFNTMTSAGMSTVEAACLFAMATGMVPPPVMMLPAPWVH